ncbi:MAG: type II toxin-antitoxin system RelE/ParE family toxin [Actinomycetota bacterium]|nr:type II toxin-antitoxin system RelE/ParE family toxin [Actinomycetota bacterium]
MIRSFRCKETEEIFHRRFVKRFPADIQRLAYRKLVLLDSVERLGDLSIPPGNQPEKLSGNRQWQCSIRINEQWRIYFKWRTGDSYEVEISCCFSQG